MEIALPDSYGLSVSDFSYVSPAPEPSSFLLLGSGLVGLAGPGSSEQPHATYRSPSSGWRGTCANISQGTSRDRVLDVGAALRRAPVLGVHRRSSPSDRAVHGLLGAASATGWEIVTRRLTGRHSC